MSLNLTNTPASFQSFMKNVLALFLDRFATTYFDDIHIYPDTLEEHQGNVSTILAILSKERLHLKPEKYEFNREEVRYLRLIIGRNKVKMNLAKVAAVSDRRVSRYLFNIWSFMSFVNFH